MAITSFWWHCSPVLVPFWCWQLNHVHDSARRVQLVRILGDHSRWSQGLQKLIHVFLFWSWSLTVELFRKAWGWFSCSCWLLSVVLSSSGRHQCWNALSGVHQRLQNLRIEKQQMTSRIVQSASAQRHARLLKGSTHPEMPQGLRKQFSALQIKTSKNKIFQGTRGLLCYRLLYLHGVLFVHGG